MYSRLKHIVLLLSLLFVGLPSFARRHAVPDSLRCLTFSVGDCSFRMQRIEGGSYVMGATSDQFDRDLVSDKPAHLISLSSFYMAETEVTIALWQALMPEWHIFDEWIVPSHPMSYISYADCLLFIHRLDSVTGMPFRLPTEAEWEYAARGGEASRHYRFAGSNFADTVAWLSSNSGNRKRSVATRLPNEARLYDMTGNIAEWCSDWYAPYQIGDGCNPQGPDSGEMRIVRGGSFANCAANSHISVRSFYTPDESNNYIGCRLALSLPNDPSFVVDTLLPLVRKERIAGQRVVFSYVPGPHPFYIAQQPVTVAQWRKITGASLEGKPSSPAVGMTQSERLSFVEKCRRKTELSLGAASDDELSQAFAAGALDSVSISTQDNARQHRWQHSDATIQQHRQRLAAAQKYADLIGYKIDIPDDPVLLAYKSDPEASKPLRLVIRL